MGRFGRALGLAVGIVLSSAAHADDAGPWFTADGGSGQGVNTLGLGLEWATPCACTWLREHATEPRIAARVSFWDARDHSTENDNLWNVSVLGGLRWKFAEASALQPFVQLSLGAGAISKTRIGPRHLSTAFQFQEQLEAGIALDPERRYELAAYARHSSNAGIEEPNDGLTTFGLELRVAIR
ncbi:MAG: acyloxyacyl hydrolase [Proteobacteria bacterium]|nr:acyloxyacyl hydrolase [Pseudomonadota bacterium]